MHNSAREIRRYHQILMAYMTVAKQVDHCVNEDKEFYQNICLLFATKIKSIQSELVRDGFIIG